MTHPPPPAVRVVEQTEPSEVDLQLVSPRDNLCVEFGLAKVAAISGVLNVSWYVKLCGSQDDMPHANVVGQLLGRFKFPLGQTRTHRSDGNGVRP
mgnify:CR=1 FL=1